MSENAKLAPSTAGVSAREKARESAAWLIDKLARMRDAPSFDWLFADLAAYDRLLESHAGRSLSQAKVLEIGYGARPYRLLAMIALGIDATGVDAEVPLLEGSWAELAAIYRANGAERLAKSVVRKLVFDRPERRAFNAALRAHGVQPRIERERLEVADAADLVRPEGSLDLVVSEDVFEHISRASLERLVPRMRQWCKPDGLALIRPNVFTGITGGHLAEWNNRSMSSPRRRRSEPWGHLRGHGLKPNTYLNELTLAAYRSLFSPHFEILEERVKYPDLGREFLTGATAAELAGWSEEELFSNQVLFVLRPRSK